MYFQEVLGLYSQDVKVAKEYFRCHDMDAEDLAKAALVAIDDWLDEEIIGFEPKGSCYQMMSVLGRASSSIAF